MGIGGISIWQLAIILLIVILIFGTKRLKSIGKDLGGAVKGFKDAVDDDKEEDKNLEQAKKTSLDEQEKSKSENTSE